MNLQVFHTTPENRYWLASEDGRFQFSIQKLHLLNEDIPRNGEKMKGKEEVSKGIPDGVHQEKAVNGAVEKGGPR